MVPRLVRLRPPYRSGVGPIVKPHIRPSRRALLVYRAWHPVLRAAVVMAVALLAALAPGMRGAALRPTLLLVAGYGAWLLLLHRLAQQPWVEAGAARRRWLAGLRKAGALAGLTILLWSNPGLSREAWLLYLLPMLTIGVDLERGWAETLVGLTMMLALLSPFAHAGLRGSLVAWGDPLWLLGLRDGLLRALVVGFIGFSTYLLHHAFAYQYQRMEAANEGLAQIWAHPEPRVASPRPVKPRITQAGMDKPPTAEQRIAKLLSRLFSSDAALATAYVLVRDPKTRMVRMVGSSNPEGDQMVRAGFHFPAVRGITGWTAEHRQPCFLNDTRDDPERRFLVSDASPHTRSALAVPVQLEEEWIEEEELTVLEVESPMPNDFASEDLQLMTLITTQLEASRRWTRELEMRRRLAELGKRIARRIEGENALDALLEDVGQEALVLLRADVIRFHYRAPASPRAARGHLHVKSVGLLRSPYITARPDDPRSLVHHLMQSDKPVYFEAAQSDSHLTLRQPWHVQQGVEPFVVREEIVACAAVPLVTGSHCVGLMWVNYRRPRHFTQTRKDRIELVAPFAMLAIHSAQQSVLAENRRRYEVERILHDTLCSNIRQTHRAVTMLAAQTPGSAAWQRYWFLAQQQTGRADRIANILLRGQEYLTLQDVVDDLYLQADLCGLQHGVETTVRVEVEEGFAGTPIDLQGGHEVMFACDELVQNALRHARPQQITIHVSVHDRCLHITIEDDGCGFDVSRVGRSLGHGLESVRARIEDSLNGRFEVASLPQRARGTRIALHVPLPHGPHGAAGRGAAGCGAAGRA